MNEISIEAQIIFQKHFKNDDFVLVAALNWGMGHASRCIPLIHWLRRHCAKVIIVSDGAALDLLKAEFPDLTAELLPSYGVTYKYKSILHNVIMSSPSVISAIIREKMIARELVNKYKATVILSDNRLGFRTKGVRNYYITHQINILHPDPIIARLGTLLHQKYIRKFDTCFVPDFVGQKALCKALSYNKDIEAEYLGPLTRIRPLNLPKEIDICVILSGPEPQRSILESLLLPELNRMNDHKIQFVRGTTQNFAGKPAEDHILMADIMDTSNIETLLNTSKLLIARSGYSTMMDINHLDIEAILIPTPGQTEQEYLAYTIQNDSKYKIINQNETNKLPEIIQSMIKS